MRASVFDPRSCISRRSFSKEVSISLSTHQFVSECFEAQSNTLPAGAKFTIGASIGGFPVQVEVA
jgi:hypothetical protein